MNVSAPPGEDSPDRGDFASVGAVIVAVSAEAMPAVAWTATQMRAGERIVVDETLIAAYQAASSPHSIRALKSDLEAFDLWCRRTNRIALPATPEIAFMPRAAHTRAVSSAKASLLRRAS